MSRPEKSDNEEFSLRERLKSFKAAFKGLAILFRNEHNARIHLAILLLVIAAGIILGITATEWLAILFVTGLVFAAECFNTAIEYLSDLITREENGHIAKAKDVAAAGVLMSAIVAIATGLIIFIPGILKLFRP